MKRYTGFPATLGLVLALSIGSEAWAVPYGWNNWKRPIHTRSAACERLEVLVDKRLDALGKIYDVIAAKLNSDGLSRKDRRYLRRQLAALTARIATLQSISYLIDRRPLSAEKCEKIEIRVVEIASFPY